MENSGFENLSKQEVIDTFISHKEEVLENFRSNQRSKLDLASNDDMDNRHIDSKNEETLNELELLNHNTEILEKEIQLLRNIPIEGRPDKVQYGSLIETDMAVMLVGAANETMEVNGTEVVGISTAAPLYKKMEGLGKGAELDMNGRHLKILSVK